MSEWAETHLPCPECGSSDALSVNDQGWGTCFACDARFLPEGRQKNPVKEKKQSTTIAPGSYRDLIARELTEATCKKFGYTVGEYNGRPVQIAPYHNAQGQLVAQKVRFPDKTFSITGTFSEATLFGQKLWGTGGKRLVIVEGEIDALSYSQATNLSWPVVSVPNGAQGARVAIEKNIEWIESFDEVVFLFDMDKPGQDAAIECAACLTPGKAKIAQLPEGHKDSNDMVVAGRIKELAQAVWNATIYRPDGIVNGKDLWAEVSTPVVMGTPYPYSGLNEYLYGMRPREIVTLTAGAGIGKSTATSEIAYHLANVLNQKVGYVALEEGVGRTGRRFLGMHLNKPLHLPHVSVTQEELKEAYDATLGTGRYLFYDHFGSLDSSHLLNKLKYLVKSEGCKFLVLDHLSIVVSGMDLDADERRMLDHTMTALRQFTEQTEVGLLLVSHLKRPDGKGHEDGAVTSLSQLRGSAAIAQLSDAVIGLERNQQGDDDDQTRLTLRVLKNRYAGRTGVATHLRFDIDTHRLVEETEDADCADDFL